MRTLGVDLAAQPKKTAACLIEWSGRAATVSSLVLGVAAQDVLDWAAPPDVVVGIDAPFGWPRPFVEFLGSGGTTNSGLRAVPPERCNRLWFRETDCRVWLGFGDRSGDGRVYEVYPAVALHVWGVDRQGYKPRRRCRRARGQAQPTARRADSDLPVVGLLLRGIEAV